MAPTHETADQTVSASGAAQRQTAAAIVRRERIIAPSRRILVGRTLAFSVTSESVQTALCAHLGKRRQLLDVRKVYIPRDLTSSEKRLQFICGLVDDLCAELARRKTTVTLTVEGSETAFRTIQLPDLRGKAFSQALWFEAKKQLPFPINECHFDFRRVLAIEDDSSRRTKVSLLSGTRRLITEQLAPFQSLHIPVDAVYHAQDVIGRLLAGLPGFGADRNYCLVNIERSRTEFAYYRGCELEFSHIISLGSSFLSNRRDDTVYEYFAETLINEIQNSLDYYSGQYTSAFSNQVYLYGDLAYSDELVDRLAPRLDFGVRRFPVEELPLFQVADETTRSTIAVCLPAVAAAVNNVKLANLLPPENKTVIASRRVDRWMYAGIGLMMCILGVASVSRYHQVADHRTKLSAVTAEVDQFRNSALFAAYDSLKQQMALDQAYLSRLKPTPSYASSLLKELSNLTPEEIRLFDLGLTADQPDRNGHMAGVVHSSNTPPEVILAEFVERLHRSPSFSQVTVDGSQKKKAGDGFDLVFQISFAGAI